MKTTARVFRLFSWKSVAAAIIILICSTTAYLLLNKTDAKQELTIIHKKPSPLPDIAAPAASNAVITFSNGAQLLLDSVKNGLVTNQGSIKILKLADGQISYTGDTEKNDATEYNTLTVPRGSKPVSLMLADGSKIWLNAGSSLQFPVAFHDKERIVDLTGEAYFEVAQDASKPFRVKNGNTEIRVLGTHFNVNAYEDEVSMKVTLLEGSVKISKGNQTNLLKPGQQAQLSNESMKLVNNPDMNEVMAWKNGLFYFEGADIKTIMRQVEKWYNVKITYQADIRYSFMAKISRQESVSELLNLLQLTNMVHFKIEGNNITVLK